MDQKSKVLWGEGLFLRPQHFQRQDRYHESRLFDTANALHPYAWGVSKLQIDPEALANNMLRVTELSLIFQDGEICKAPSEDDLPEPIDLSNLPPSRQTLLFYAALPTMKTTAGNVVPMNGGSHAGNAMRYIQSNVNTPDMFTRAADAEVAYLKKSVRLVSELDARDSLMAIPVLRLRRASTSGFEIDPSFMAPSLSIQSTPILFARLRRLLDALQAKVNALYGHHREPSKNVVEFRSGDISSFWLLHTASTAYAQLSHYYHHPQFHPERLFEQLLAITGALLTFSKSHTLADLPSYEHQNPGPGFAKLDAMMRELLDIVISSRYFAIALSETKPSYHLGQLDSGRIDDKATLFLAVGADIPAVELVEIVPLRFKVGAPEDVDKFVLAALPGVKLVHSPQVPAAVPVRPDTYYFSIESKGAMYERMLQAQSICIYVPAGIRELKLELLAVTA